MTRRRGLLVGVTLLAGLAAALALALFRGDSFHDAAVLGGIATGTSAGCGALGLLVLAPVRRQSVGRQAVGVALVVVVAVVVGVLAAAKAMFISSHDLNALMVVVIGAGSAGGAAALALGARVDRDAQAVAALARGITAETGTAPVGAAPPPTAELAALAGQIRVVQTELELSRDRERALDQSRRELVAWVSHDLRSPLSSIRAMAEAMEDGVVCDAGTVARYHTAIRSETQRLSALVEDLFELSRITAGVTGLKAERVPLAELVDEAVEPMMARAAAAGVRLERRSCDLGEVVVVVSELSRAIQNLLDNAIRHTPSGGTVSVDGELVPGGALLIVEDQCGGIPEPDLARVFDLAFRGDSARGRDGGGGLGLTIAKGLVEAHEGALLVANQTDGCRFTIELRHPVSAGIDGVGRDDAGESAAPLPTA